MNRPPLLGSTTITGAGATDRTVLPDQECSEIMVFAPSGNTGTIYIGDGTVTNAGGASPGIPIAKGTTFPVSIKLLNSKQLAFATDNANDKVRWLIW